MYQTRETDLQGKMSASLSVCVWVCVCLTVSSVIGKHSHHKKGSCCSCLREMLIFIMIFTRYIEVYTYYYFYDYAASSNPIEM